MQLESSVTLFDDTKVEDRFAELQITADGITSEVSKKVGNNEVISRINQSAESVTINANKVNIEGAAIFSSGRLSQSSLNNAYDANGAAAGEVNNLKSDLSSSAGTTVINGGHIATGSMTIGALDTNAQNTIADAAKTASTYITDIGSGGISVHATSNPTSNYVQIDGNGMDVYNGGTSVANFGTTARIGKPATANTGNVFIDSDSVDIRKGADVLATFGTDGMRIGKSGEKRIEVKSNAFNIYDEDGSIPFQVSTSGSLKTLPHTRWSTVSANVTTSTQIYYKGTLVDNKVYFGVATSGKPSPSANLVLTNPDTTYTVTVSGVTFRCSRNSSGYIFCYIQNTNSASRVWLINFTQSYRETLVKENNHILSPQGHALSATGTTGTCGQITIKTYGGIAHLCIAVYQANVIDGGAIYKGTIGGFVPAETCYFMGFAGAGKLCIGHLSVDGEITIINASGSTLTTTASSMAWLSATYIMKD